MNQGNCELCERWDSRLDGGVCPTCRAKFRTSVDVPLIIGIAGPARVGKDTAADYLIEVMPEYVKASFADPLKDMLRIGLGLDAAQLYGDDKEVVDHRYGCTPRHIMQTLGTEWGRQLVHGDIWVKAMAARCKSATIIPDIRFANEAQFVRERGVLLHIDGRGGIDGGHVSESGVEFQEGDLIVINDGGLGQFHRGLKNAFNI